jgi:hypothetical protein
MEREGLLLYSQDTRTRPCFKNYFSIIPNVTEVALPL